MENIGIIIYPDEIDSDFDKIEIHPVRTGNYDPDDWPHWEQCEDYESEMWCVYIHRVGIGITCIADCKTKRDAEDLKKLIERVRDHYKK